MKQQTILCLCYNVPGLSLVRQFVISLEGFISGWKSSPRCAYLLNKWLSLKLDVYKVYGMFCVCASTVCVGGGGVFSKGSIKLQEMTGQEQSIYMDMELPL